MDKDSLSAEPWISLPDASSATVEPAAGYLGRRAEHMSTHGTFRQFQHTTSNSHTLAKAPTVFSKALK